MSQHKAEYNKAYYSRNRKKQIATVHDYYLLNRDKILERQKAVRASDGHKIYTRENNWKAKGIVNIDGSRFTVGDYGRLYHEQKGLCAICKQHGSSFSRGLFVDHDHNKGDVRALSCHFCKAGLGDFRESEDILLSAISYIKVKR